MERQGFDPITSTLAEVVDFMERIEQSEDFDGQRVDNGQKTSANSSNNKKKKSNHTNSGSKTCLIHGTGTHSSNECKVLQALAKDSKKDGTSGGKAKGKFGNKSWSRKADDAKGAAKKDLAAFIKKAVAKGVQKELNSVDKKKKRSASFDLNAFDDNELKDFNYEDMENLKIDSDDESTSSVSV